MSFTTVSPAAAAADDDDDNDDACDLFTLSLHLDVQYRGKYHRTVICVY